MNLREPDPPTPSNPTPPVTLDVSNGGELANPLDIATIAVWGHMGIVDTDPPLL